jgi:hypothetical protein
MSRITTIANIDGVRAVLNLHLFCTKRGKRSIFILTQIVGVEPFAI